MPGEVLSHNFGPINHEGGERRLNVAVTRAKWELVLVSSILAGDIDESKVQSSGPGVLKRYLGYARDGRLPPETTLPTGEAESWFEERVWDALKEHGIEADRNVGVSRYRIDLAIKHPVQPGRYLLGIECDGAAYHSTKLARDRDRLRQQVLEQLGWKIHRIWSTDWIRDQRGALQRLLDRIETLVREPIPDGRSSPFVPRVRHTPAPGAILVEPENPAPKERRNDPPSSVGQEYPSPLKLNLRRDLFETEDTEAIRKVVLQMVEHEGPIHEDLLVVRVRSAFMVQRTGPHVEAKIKRQIARAQDLKLLSRRGQFLWPPALADVAFRRPKAGEDARRIEHVPPEEIESAIIEAIRQSRGISRQEVVPEARKLLGYERAGDRIAPAIDSCISRLLEKGRAFEQGGFLHLPG